MRQKQIKGNSTKRWSVLFKNLNILNNNEELGSSSRLKETKESWQLNAMHDQGSGTGSDPASEEKLL